MDFRPEFDDFDISGMELRLDNGSYRSLNGGVPPGAFGWRALVDHLETQLGSADFLRIGEGDPRRPDAIYGYRRTEDKAHWLLVAVGLSELEEKRSNIPDQSGWGYAVAVRFASDNPDPPAEAIEILNAVFGYVAIYCFPLAPNHTLDLNGLIESNADGFGYLALRRDPLLGEVVTPNGTVDMLQVVVTTEAEQQAMCDWNNEGVLKLLEEKAGSHLVADPHRGCLCSNPETMRFIDERVTEEGSSGQHLFVYEAVSLRIDGDRYTLEIDQESVATLLRRIRGRLPFGRQLQVYADLHEISIAPSEESSLAVCSDSVTLHLDPAAIADLIDGLQNDKTEFCISGLEKLYVKIVCSSARDAPDDHC